MDIDSFICSCKNRRTAEDVETRFMTSNFELDRSLSKGKNWINER